MYETTVRRGGGGTPGKKVRGVPARTHRGIPEMGCGEDESGKGRARGGEGKGRGSGVWVQGGVFWTHALGTYVGDAPAACGFGADESGAALGAGGPTRSPEPTRSGDALRAAEGGGEESEVRAVFSAVCGCRHSAAHCSLLPYFLYCSPGCAAAGGGRLRSTCFCPPPAQMSGRPQMRTLRQMPRS